MTALAPDELFDAKRRLLPWSRTAAAAAERLAASDEKATPRSAVLKALSSETGYSIPILLRQIGLLRFIAEVAHELETDANSLRDRPFSVLELAWTLYKRDRAEGLKALKDILAGTAEVKSLRKAIEELRLSRGEGSGPEEAARERHERHKRILEILERDAGLYLEPRPRDWGLEEAKRRGLTDPPVCRFTWWCRRNRRLGEPPLLEGFDLLYAPSGSTSKWLDDRIARALVSSTFFDLYWILIAEPTPYLNRIAAALSLPPRPEIGVAIIDPYGRIVEPFFRSAEPRRRDAQERAIIEAFAPDRSGD